MSRQYKSGRRLFFHLLGGPQGGPGPPDQGEQYNPMRILGSGKRTLYFNTHVGSTGTFLHEDTISLETDTFIEHSNL